MNHEQATDLASRMLADGDSVSGMKLARYVMQLLGGGQTCGAIEPAVGEDMDGCPAVLVPEEWPGSYSPDDTRSLVVMLVVALEQAEDEAAMREETEPTARKVRPEQEWERD